MAVGVVGAQRTDARPCYLEVASHIADLLGGLVDPRLVRAVAELTGGELRAVTEVVLDAKETGCLERGATAWQLSAALPTRGLVGLASARVIDLGPDLRDQARLLALGSPLTIRIAGAVLDPRHVRELEAMGLARFREDGGEQQVVISDAIHREAVLAGLAPEERLELVRRLADAFDRVQPEDDNPGGSLLDPTPSVRTARWRLQVGGWSAERFERAAACAYASSDSHLAQELATRAVELGDGCDGAVMRAVALAANGEVVRAEGAEWLARTRARDDRDRMRVAIAEAHRHAIGHGRWRQAAESLLDMCAGLASGPSSDVARAYAALLHAMDSDPDSANRVLETSSYDVGDDEVGTGPSSVEARIVAEVAAAFAAAARLDRPRIKRAVAVVAGLSDAGADVPLAAELTRGLALLEADGRPPQERLRTATEELGRAFGQPDPITAWWLTVAGRLHLSGGDLGSARDDFAQALLLTETSDPVRLRPHLIADLALVCALGGLPTEAERWLDDLGDERRNSTAIAARCELIAIVIAAQNEGPTTATTLALAVGDRAIADGRLRDAAFAWHLTARLGDASRAVERLAEGGALPDHPGVTLARRHATALAREDADALVTVAKELAGVGRYLVAAEAAAQAARLGGEHVAFALAGGLAAACPDVRSPSLDGIERVSLSPRRREVAAAAIEGAGGPEIASALDLSLRTVDNHLARVYRLLGVSGRTELGQVYRPDHRPLAEPR